VAIVTSAQQGDRVLGDAVTVLRSVGGRLPFSLYGLGADSTDGGGRLDAGPLASAIVHRTGGVDVVAVGRDFTQTDTCRLWSGAIDRSSRLRIAAPQVGPTLAIAPVLLGSAENADVGFNALLRAVDLDADGSEEVVAVSSDASNEPVLFVGRYGAAGYGLTLVPTVIPAGSAPSRGGSYARVFGLEPIDIDADGDLDLVALLASAPGFAPGNETDIFDLSARDTVLVVIPNEAGQLVPERSSVLATPAKVHAMAVGRIGNRTQDSLVILTDDGAAQATRQTVSMLESGQFNALYTNSSETPPGGRVLPGARSLLVTDVSGDGISDLVVGGGARLTVLRAETRNR